MSAIHFREGVVCIFGAVLIACEDDSTMPPLPSWEAEETMVTHPVEVEAEDDPSLTAQEWLAVFPTRADAQDLLDAKVSLYIPDHVSRVRGVLLFSHAGVGESEFEHKAWRISAANHGYGLMKIDVRDRFDRVTPWESPGQSASLITRVFDTMARVSGHDELKRCPLVFFGHSAGGFWITRFIPHLTERTAGFVAFHGGLESDAFFSPPVLSIPGLFLVAEYDLPWIREDGIRLVETGRNMGARWSLVVEPNTEHSDPEPGRWLMVMFVETVINHRIPDRGNDSDHPVLLQALPEQAGWLGQLIHRTVYDGDEAFKHAGKEEITGAAIRPWKENERDASWLISEAFAKSWLAFERQGISNP